MAIPRVSPDEAKKLVDAGYLYVDVRSEPSTPPDIPPESVNVPVMNAGPRGMEPNASFLDVMNALYPKDAKLVLGCRSGQRSMRAATMLVDAGFMTIADQRAGFEGTRDAFGAVAEPGWAASGLPTETATPGGSYEELKKKSGR